MTLVQLKPSAPQRLGLLVTLTLYFERHRSALVPHPFVLTVTLHSCRFAYWVVRPTFWKAILDIVLESFERIHAEIDQ